MSIHLFTVRAVVADPAKRAAFDDWYAKEHLPQAVAAFGAQKAWRCWSVDDPSVHLATYQFADSVSLERATGGDAMKQLIADFDRCWCEVRRTRDIWMLAETIAAD
jgi:hypothetical protein